MNGWAILGLVFIYGMTALGLICLPLIIGKPQESTPGVVRGVVTLNILDAIATLVVWGTREYHTAPLTAIAAILVIVDIFYIISVIWRLGTVRVLTASGAVRVVLLSVLWVTLLSILAFA